MKKKRTSHKRLDESTANIQGNPKSAYGMLNKYGTYEIQPTADTENTFPLISSGLADKTCKVTKDDINEDNK